jgi:hypothetical protein
MPNAPERLTSAAADDVADALAFALRFSGRKRVHNADEVMAEIVAKRLVEHLERSGFVVMKRPLIQGGGARTRFRGLTRRLSSPLLLARPFCALTDISNWS